MGNVTKVVSMPEDIYNELKWMEESVYFQNYIYEVRAVSYSNSIENPKTDNQLAVFVSSEEAEEYVRRYMPSFNILSLGYVNPNPKVWARNATVSMNETGIFSKDFALILDGSNNEYLSIYIQPIKIGTSLIK